MSFLDSGKLVALVMKEMFLVCPFGVEEAPDFFFERADLVSVEEGLGCFLTT